MKKGYLECIINNNIIRTNYIIKDNILYFDDNNLKITYDIEKDILTKEDNDSKLYMYFNEEKFTYYLKEYDKLLEGLLENISIVKNDNNIKLKYKINDNDFFIEIIYKEDNNEY